MPGKERLRRTFGTNAHLVLRIVLEETLDTTAGKLYAKDISHYSTILADPAHRSQRAMEHAVK